MPEKTKGELLQEKLCYEVKNAGEEMSEQELAKADGFCEAYKAFLDYAKMEREAVEFAVSVLEERGYRAFEPGKEYKTGDKVYYNNRARR